MARSAPPSFPPLLLRLLLPLLLRAAVVASASCSVSWKVRCEYSGEARSTLLLLVEDDDEAEPYEYDVSQIVFRWGPGDTPLGTRTYATGTEARIRESYEYEPEGEYYIGYTFTLVDVCGGKTFWDYKLLRFEEGEDCDFDDVDTSDVPTRTDSEPPTALPTALPTPPPSEGPTAMPSKRPTSAPTSSPTENPTDRPTNSPTERPTDRPTNSPTERPTDRPTNIPTREPSLEPTIQPTLRPSANPTRRPTDRPTQRPTARPTGEPSLRPTAGPTRRPTTARPTPPPTRNPTDRPTDGTTGGPTTAAPSDLFEVSRLEPHSAPLSDGPTGGPTGEPTEGSTAVGTNLPLNPPEFFTCGDGDCSAAEHAGVCRSDCSGLALDVGSEGEGGYADVRGVAFSIRAGRNVLVTSVDVFSTDDGVVAAREEAGGGAAGRVEVFARAGGHRGYESAREAWTPVFDDGEGVPVREGDVASFFVFARDGRVRCRTGTGGVGDVATSDGVLELHQGVEVDEKWTAVDGGNEGVVPLVLVGSIRYEIVESFPTSAPVPDSIAVVGSGKTLSPTPVTTRPHPEPTAINVPLSSSPALSSSNGTASPTAESKVEPAVDQPPRNDVNGVVGAGSTEGDGTSTYMIVSAVTGSACVFLLAMVAGNYYVKQMKMKSTASKKTKSTLAAALDREPPDFEPVIKVKHKDKHKETDDVMNQPVATIESKEGEVDDVSTLGDPYLGDAAIAMGGDNTIGESMISSQQELYVYGVRKAQGMGASRVGGSTVGPVFGEDTTLEDVFHSQHDSSTPDFRQLKVPAPSGELGIVLDNSHGELPIVWAIKESSSLHGKVRVGDALLSVDGVDCRGMSTQEVSTFLGGRSQNPTRMLALARSCEVGAEMLGV